MQGVWVEASLHALFSPSACFFNEKASICRGSTLIDEEGIKANLYIFFDDSVHPLKLTMQSIF